MIHPFYNLFGGKDLQIRSLLLHPGLFPVPQALLVFLLRPFRPFQKADRFVQQEDHFLPRKIIQKGYHVPGIPDKL